MPYYIGRSYRVTISKDSDQTLPVNCPYCHIQALKLDRDKLLLGETLRSQKEHSDPNWEPEWNEYYFSGSVLCEVCKETTYCCGRGTEHYYQVDDDEWEDDIQLNFLFFQPSPLLFTIPVGCPKKVTDVLMSSFSLAYSDPSAACGRLRTAVEKWIHSLDEDIPENGTLHNKLVAFEKTDAHLSRLLLAVK